MNLVKILGELLDVLYEAVGEANAEGEYYISVNQPCYICLPSGLCIDLSVDFRISLGEIPDSIWFVYIYLPDYGWCKIDCTDAYRLGDVSPYITFARMMIKKWLTTSGLGNLEGSQHFLFKDEDTGEIKRGTEFTPTRYYNILVDGDTDMYYVAMALGIIVALKQANLGHIASKFYAKYLAFKQKKWRGAVSSDLEEILLKQGEQDVTLASILEDVEGMSDVQILALLEEIKQRIGLRLTL